jgi:hypothetical protein
VTKFFVATVLPVLCVNQLFGARREPSSATIRGAVTECREGKKRPVAGLSIYALQFTENSQVFSMLEKLRQFPIKTTKDNQEFIRLFEQLVNLLKPLQAGSSTARTDNFGEYTKINLKFGERYILIAIDGDKGDSDDLYYYRSLLTQPLQRKTTTQDFYMGPGRVENCDGK